VTIRIICADVVRFIPAAALAVTAIISPYHSIWIQDTWAVNGSVTLNMHKDKVAIITNVFRRGIVGKNKV
jgi:hypothetical protein